MGTCPQTPYDVAMERIPAIDKTIINARGTYTPLGVSRSSRAVATAVSIALEDFAHIDSLHAAVAAEVAAWAGAEAATVTHCTAASVTLAVAAAMTGTDAKRIQQLPDTIGLRNAVIVPAGHAVNYGHPLVTDVRLAGARPRLCGALDALTEEHLAEALSEPDVACLLLVSSRLSSGPPKTDAELTACVALAHARGIPVIIDGAAQDWRVNELLATGADVVLVSAQKYLGAPTAGLVLGKRAMVDAVRAQEQGVGRAMKTTKEALAGVRAAVHERRIMDQPGWMAEQRRKVARCQQAIERLELPGLVASAIADPSGLPFSRVRIQVDPMQAGRDAVRLAHTLREGCPPVWTIDRQADRGCVDLELVALHDDEIDVLVDAIAEALSEAV